MTKKSEYKTHKIGITLSSDILKKLNKVKMFPKWKGNRSAVIEAALDEFLGGDK